MITIEHILQKADAMLLAGCDENDVDKVYEHRQALGQMIQTYAVQFGVQENIERFLPAGIIQKLVRVKFGGDNAKQLCAELKTFSDYALILEHTNHDSPDDARRIAMQSYGEPLFQKLLQRNLSLFEHGDLVMMG